MEYLIGSRQYALNGVLNGIDYTEWNPATDAHLPAKYSAQDLPGLSGKARCKSEMQKELGLPVRDDVPMLAFIGRLDSQKGADLIIEASRWIVEQVHQFLSV
jgi:starch synthase